MASTMVKSFAQWPILLKSYLRLPEIDRVMKRILWLTELLAGLCLCFVRENGAYQQSDATYSIVSSPDLPSDYANNADASFSDVSSVVSCVKHCTRSSSCEASVLDTSSSTCLLYDTAYVNVSEASSGNDLRYIENVCSPTALMRPSYCLPVEARNFKDCQAAFENGRTVSGVYTITPEGYDSFEAWCDFDQSHGWTVFQRRLDGSVNFNLNWAEYKAGFGNIDGEYWLGNDNLFALTRTNRIMNLYLQKWDGSERTANYSNFYINDENDNYRLTVSGYSGDAEDSIAGGTGHTASGWPFSTPDRDNDNWSSNCASHYRAAWWYQACHHANLNGIYTTGSSTDGSGIVWAGSWSSGHSIPMHKTTMRLTRN